MPQTASEKVQICNNRIQVYIYIFFYYQHITADQKRPEGKPTFCYDSHGVEGDPDGVPHPGQQLPLGVNAGQHVEGVPEAWEITHSGVNRGH